MANENVTHHTTSAQKVFEKIQNMNFKLYIYTKKSYLTVATLTVVFVPIPLSFLIFNKIFCPMPGDLDGRTN